MIPQISNRNLTSESAGLTISHPNNVECGEKGDYNQQDDINESEPSDSNYHSCAQGPQNMLKTNQGNTCDDLFKSLIKYLC